MKSLNYKEMILDVDFLNLVEHEQYIQKRLDSKLILKEELRDIYNYLCNVYTDLKRYLEEHKGNTNIRRKIENYLLNERLEQILENKNDNKHQGNRRKI